METETRPTGFFSQFPKIFWIVNTLELFERGAYYGTMAVLQFHFLLNLFPGLPNVGTVYGLIYTFFIFILYFVPLVSAALAEKFGYRFVLIVSFITLIAGYILMFMVRPGNLGFFILALIVLGFGAGAFKPIISASIAHVTADEQRNVAYSIYYWMINLGATVFPLVLALIFTHHSSFYYYFIISAAVIGINLLISVFMYVNPVEPQQDLKVSNAIRRIIPALQDKKFVILLIIYAGFWFMFSVGQTYLGWYMLHFQRMPSWFPINMLAVFNPLTIIIVGPVLAKLVDKQKSMNMIMLGICIFCFGLFVIGFSNSSQLFVTGIVIFSIGEFITHPGFIAYVSKIAPKKVIAIYMASIFLSTGVGQMAGSTIQGIWYDYYIFDLHWPKLYFASLLCVGLLTLIGFIMYNRWMIREELEKDPHAIVDTRIHTKPVAILIVLLMMVVVAGVAITAGTDTFHETEIDGAGEDFTWADFETGSGFVSESGFTQEADNTEVELSIDQVNLAWVYVNLTWTDEPDERARNNQPDTFSIEVETPGGQTYASIQYSQGPISIPIKLAPEQDSEDNETGVYKIIVNCHDAGNHEPIVGGQFGVLEIPDDGNNWNLVLEYSYYESKE